MHCDDMAKKNRCLDEVEQLIDGLDEKELKEVLGYLRMLEGEDPGVEPEIILRMYRTLIVGMRRCGGSVPNDILTRLSVMVQEILDTVPNVRERYILRSFFLLGDDVNQNRVENALDRSGIRETGQASPA